MGAAVSNNAAEAVTNVTNYVDQSTKANTSQVNQLSQGVKLSQCVLKFKGDFNINESAKLAVTNNQIVQAQQDANLQNNIQQQMLQQATSKVGALGIGYAKASNSASEFANASSSIINAMSASASQYSTTNQNFECDRSYIEANNMNISFGSTSDFLSTQTLKQQQTAQIVNDISQTVKQTASATVEGIAGLLIAIAIIIAALGYGISKPLSSGGMKIIIMAIVAFLLAAIIVWMYLAKAPPFFSEPNECIANSSIGGCDSDCVDQSIQEIHLASAPFRYLYGIGPHNVSLPGGNLVQMVIAKLALTGNLGSGDNGGYRADVANAFNQARLQYSDLAKKMGVSTVPDVLIPVAGRTKAYYAIPKQYRVTSGGGSGSDDTQSAACTPAIVQFKAGATGTLQECALIIDPVQQGVEETDDPTQAVANLNVDGWQNYLNTDGEGSDTKDNRALYARFVLCAILGNIDLHIYVLPNEPVQYRQNNNLVVGLARDMPADQVYQFIVQDGAGNNWADGINASGTLVGAVGYCNNRTYKFQKFMRHIGGWIMLAVIILLFAYMFFTWFAARRGQPAKKE